jgi:hypothetical protein
MTNKNIAISEDEFDNRYLLVANPFNANAGWDGCLFETYGEELAFVQRQNPRTVWTLVDGDDGEQYVISGFHVVNRIGYLVSSEAVSAEAEIEVRLPMPETDDADEE